eukprot:5238764-Pleurochrysis_carterae.AAC.2
MRGGGAGGVCLERGQGVGLGLAQPGEQRRREHEERGAVDGGGGLAVDGGRAQSDSAGEAEATDKTHSRL